MKKISLLFVLSILSIQLSTAQNQQTESDPKKETLTSNKAGGNQWIFGLGFNTVNNSGAEFKDLSNSDHWAFGKIPFYGSVATQFTDKWAAKATLSFNYFKDGKVMNGETILGVFLFVWMGIIVLLLTIEKVKLLEARHNPPHKYTS